MSEYFRKLGLYFRKADAYWQLSGAAGSENGVLGRYPLDLVPRLTTGHLDSFDKTGLPLRFNGKGLVHNYSTLCCFALAHWDCYLTTSHEFHLQKFLLVAQYIVHTAKRTKCGVRLRAEIPGIGHAGGVSSLTQGEGISVLCRAWQVTKNSEYLEVAIGCLEVFELPAEQDGVMGVVSRLKIPWYEEYPVSRPAHHVLNGMIYALWGLHDLFTVSQDARALRLFQLGVESLAKVLPLFDTGFWSLYSLPEAGRPYLASMTYHSLHTCQLTSLAGQTKQLKFAEHADRFAEYSRSALCRIRAAGTMLRQKVIGTSVDWTA